MMHQDSGTKTQALIALSVIMYYILKLQGVIDVVQTGNVRDGENPDGTTPTA